MKELKIEQLSIKDPICYLGDHDYTISRICIEDDYVIIRDSDGNGGKASHIGTDISRQPITVDNFPLDGKVYDGNSDCTILLPDAKPYNRKQIEYRINQKLWYVPLKSDLDAWNKHQEESDKLYNMPCSQG